MRPRTIPSILLLCVLAACDQTAHKPSASQSERPVGPHVAATSGVPSAWLGRWNGPEGTYLEVLADGGKHKVSIRNLDGVRTFEATSTSSGLAFERDGIGETIEAGSGKDTGMKWLQEKTNCLVVKTGEGYCRD